ncbi:MAG: DUF1156 domain-containing protein [Myxococcaceae bacterium]|nr:MAG: DUF1156 domain-containing protein [Myxococcaceae bacterium]
MTRRLIETWMPIAALGEESVRERKSMTALPPTYYLHVWWARRPLVASRAAILASLLPAEADHGKFLRMVGIHGDPAATRRRIDAAKRTGEDLGEDVYGYRRAFTHIPTKDELEWLRVSMNSIGIRDAVVLDPTAGGGSIPFESVRLGLKTLSNDLNPVAALIELQTTSAPLTFGSSLLAEFNRISEEFLLRLVPKIQDIFPPEPEGTRVESYLWARTIQCPHCEGEIPLSPNWRLSAKGMGVRVVPDLKSRTCSFDIVSTASQQSPGTVSNGDAQCPYPGCGRIVDADTVRESARQGTMGDRLFAVVYKTRSITVTKAGKVQEKWTRHYRSATSTDEVGAVVAKRFQDRESEWTFQNILPNEEVPHQHPKWTLRRWGILRWTQVFSPRQLFVHCAAAEVFVELLEEERSKQSLTDVKQSAFHYLAFSLDKYRDYNSRMSAWYSGREVMEHTFREHAFVFKWSYAEMAPAITGLGCAWAIGQTRKCIRELLDLLGRDVSAPKKASANQAALDFSRSSGPMPVVTVTCKSADSLDHIADQSVDAIVMDPPYYDNVMYAELSDFFYVWLKRSSGLMLPEFFRRQLTDKENEAVAAPAKFHGHPGAAELADADYRDRMASIFTECRRVLKTDGILTLMFTHKAVGAWDALASGLLEAGFVITASWPINTEAESSMHIKERAAANSTIFLACRPRPSRVGDMAYWEDVEPLVASAVRRRIEEFYLAGIRGVDLYLSCFGPALEEFSTHWPLKRGRPRPGVAPAKGRARGKPSAPVDQYAVTAEDALDAARREVKRWRLDKLARKRQVELDPVTEWFVLAWDAFEAPAFPYDEALRLARVVGVDLDRDIIGRLAERKKSSSDMLLWDSELRTAKGTLGPVDGSRTMIDALHHAAYLGRTRNLDAARELLAKSGVDKNPAFLLAMEAVLAVLPVGSTFTRVEEAKSPVADAAADFDTLEQLRRLAFANEVRKPEQLKLWESV